MIISEMNTTPQRKPKVIIVGGGFGGIRAARQLSRHGELELTLISASDSFAYYPQLYHAATGGVRSESSIPLSELLSGQPVAIVNDTVTQLNADAHTVTGASGQAYTYDYLILGLGSVTNYFGIQGLKEFSYDIKSITGAERFKKHLHDQLLNQATDLNYVVVGGGPTGVELAASLGGYLRRITRLHGIAHPKYGIELIEAAPRVLPRSPESFSARTQRRLEELGIKVMTNTAVQAETADALQLKGQSLTTRTVVWTAGVSTAPFYKDNAAQFTLAKNGKVEVNEHLEARPGIYVIGDNAATQYSGMAQTAIYDADFAARDLVAALHNRPRAAYQPKQPISVIPVGDNWAGVQWGKVLMYGFIGGILRRLADLVAYADLESWPQAVRVWLKDFGHEDNCKICQPAAASAEPPASTPAS
jgi:NADH:ubiquinone reductase (H+-translocating)